MPPSVLARFEKVVNLYERGVLTRNTALCDIVSLAVHLGFYDHLDRLPDGFVDQLREIGANLPGHPEDYCLSVGAGSPRWTIVDELFVTSEDRDVEADRKKVREYWATRRLREHFHPDEPLPEFERVKPLGEVDDVIVMEGDVVAVGDFHFPYQPWRESRPLHLLTPDDRRLGVAILTWVPPDPESPSAMARERGRTAVVVGDPSVQTPEDVPLGTTLWMDRSHLPPIPDEPPAWVYES